MEGGYNLPIHKENSYRGIISSCIGKVNVKLLTKRIYNLMVDSGKWKLNKCGIKPVHCSEDNLIILIHN